MLKRAGFLILFLFGSQVYLSSNVQANFESEAHEYMAAVINSLGMTKDAFTTISIAPTNNDLPHQISDTRKALEQLKGAKEKIAKYKNSSNEYTATSADAFHRIFGAAITLDEEKLGLLEKLGGLSQEELKLNQEVIANYGASVSEKYELFWKSLAQAAGVAKFSLVDYSRKVGETTPYFAITQDEKTNLLKLLDETFGDEIQKNPKELEHKFAAIPAILRLYLNSADLKPSDVY